MKRLAALSICLAVFAAGCSKDEDTKYGKTLVDEFKVPAETLVKFEKFKPSERKPGETALEAAMLADTEAWNGPVDRRRLDRQSLQDRRHAEGTARRRTRRGLDVGRPGGTSATATARASR
jgi:hypothetical protein